MRTQHMTQTVGRVRRLRRRFGSRPFWTEHQLKPHTRHVGRIFIRSSDVHASKSSRKPPASSCSFIGTAVCATASSCCLLMRTITEAPLHWLIGVVQSAVASSIAAETELLASTSLLLGTALTCGFAPKRRVLECSYAASRQRAGHWPTRTRRVNLWCVKLHSLS